MGQFHDASGMFRGVSYNKFTSAALRAAMERKVQNVKAKIEERKVRIAKIREENSITDAMLSDMVIQYMQDQQRGQQRVSYSNSAQPNPQKKQEDGTVVVPAGVIANIITEKGLIESESSEVKKMTLILRNLRDTLPHVGDNGLLVERPAVHTLTDEEIEYLGFSN